MKEKGILECFVVANIAHEKKKCQKNPHRVFPEQHFVRME